MPVANTTNSLSYYGNGTRRVNYAAGTAPLNGESHLVIIGLANAAPAITDSQGNTYTRLYGWDDVWDGGGVRSIFFCPRILGNPTYLEIVTGIATDHIGFIQHIRMTEVDEVNPLGASNSARGNLVNPTLELVTTSNSELLVAVLELNGTRDVATDLPSFKDPEASNLYIFTVQDAGVAGLKTLSCSLSSGGTPINAGFAFGGISLKGAGGSSTPRPPRILGMAGGFLEMTGGFK